MIYEFPNTIYVNNTITHSYSISPDGKFVCENNNGNFRWRELHKSNELKIKVDSNLTPRSVNIYAYNPNGKTFALGLRIKGKNDVQVIELWDITTNTLIKTMQYKDPVNHIRDLEEIVFSPDGKQLVTVGDTCFKMDDRGFDIDFWDITTGKITNSIHDYSPGSFFSSQHEIVFSPDGKTFAFTILGNAKLVLWNNSTKKVTNLKVGVVKGVSFSQDGSLIAVDNELYNVSTGKIIKTIESPGQMRFSLSGKFLAIVEEKTGNISIWDIKTGKVLYTIVGYGGTIKDIEFSNDEKKLLSIGEDSEVAIWFLKEPQ
jgi:WD40 repeat protein